MVALVGDEHLGLLLQPAEGRGVDDAVAVAGEGGAGGAGRLGMTAPAGPGRVFGPGDRLGLASPVMGSPDLQHALCAGAERALI